MWLSLLSTVVLGVIPASPLNLDYLDPINLQTVTTPQVQKRAALHIIHRYSHHVTVEVNHRWFKEKKDFFHLHTDNGRLHITASTGVAAVWGFNYYLKKYCNSQIEWQTKNVNIPDPLPEVDETVIANDRFRYYQNACTVSYSFVWWNIQDWKKHLEWMALNGINLSLAPVAQEAIWAQIYREMGMTQEEIDKHFTGPAFLSWLRLGNIHGWGGPLPQSWHDLQLRLQITVINAMLNLGIVPVLPAFNGHVPTAFLRIFPLNSFHTVKPWSNFGYDYCCGLFVNPMDPLFKEIGLKFLKEMGKMPGCHIFSSDPFNEIVLSEFNTDLVVETARNLFLTISEFDDQAVWLLQNWMFFSTPYNWPKERVQAFLDSLPNGRILILDMQSERIPRYDTFDMYFGHPFIWCMLHNFGGTLGMFGNMVTINKDVYEVRSRANSTMIGIGLTPEGINQNYVVYDLMLESAWRKSPVEDLEAWTADYARRRYGCNDAAIAWKYLLESVYSYEGFGRVDGSNIVTRKPSFNYNPWAWYKSADLFEAFRSLVFVNSSNCNSHGYNYDLVDVTRQVLQYRIEQLFVKMVNDRNTNKFNASVQKFLSAFDDMSLILNTEFSFRAAGWFSKARALGNTSEEADLYEYNAWNQITWWGPSAQLNDYACKQWSEMISYYYKPGWAKFLYAALRKNNNDDSEEESHNQRINVKPISGSSKSIYYYRRRARRERTFGLAQRLYYKWVSIPFMPDLRIVNSENPVKTAEDYYDSDYDTEN